MQHKKKEKKPPVIGRVFTIAEFRKGLLNISVTSAVLGAMCSLVPFISVYFISREFLMPSGSAPANESVLFWILMAGAAIIGNMLFSFLGSYGCHYVAFTLLSAFKLRVTEHLGSLSLHYFNKKTTGGIQKNIDECADRIENFIGHMLPDLFASLFMVLTLLLGMFILSPWLALTVFVSVVVAVAMQLSVFGTKFQKIWADILASDQKITGAFSEYVTGMAEVKLFGLTGKITRSLEKNIQNYSNWEQMSYRKSAVPMGLYKSIILSMLSFILPVGILLMTQNPAPETLLSVLMALIITPALYDPLMTCLSYGTQMATLSVGMDAIEELLEEKPLVFANTQEKLKHSDVTFQGVSFSYHPQEENRSYALQNIHFTAQQGKMTALVGESGGGKSTIGQLIARFYDVEDGEGTICIGGTDIKNIPYDVLMDSIAYVMQDSYLFSASIYDNITMNRKHTKQAVEEAAKAAQCHDFILGTKNGYDTKLGSSGIRLSGGETQRLSIARALLKDAPIVILDEALAYSDAENENLIQEALYNLTKNKTVILIAHRLKSVMRAEQILLLENGAIKERGTHDELMQNEGRYKSLWNLQHTVDDFTLVQNEKGGVQA